MLCWPYARIALKMTILLAHNPMVSVRALKGGCNWKNQLFRVRDRPPVVPLYVDAHRLDNLTSQGTTPTGTVEFVFNGKGYHPGPRNHWKTTIAGMEVLAKARRIQESLRQI